MEAIMTQRASIDGPASPLFTPIPLDGNAALSEAGLAMLSPVAREAVQHAPWGDCVCWGIPFHVGRVAVATTEPVQLEWPPVRCRWLVFMHATDFAPQEPGPQ